MIAEGGDVARRRGVLLGVALACIASVAVHVLLAAALAACLAGFSGPDASSAALDAASVELSFAERDDDVEAVAQMPSSPPQEASPRPDPGPPSPPRADALPLPPDPASFAVAPPEHEVERIAAAERTPQDDAARETSMETAREAPRQARVDAPPRPRKTIRPDYPEGARRRGEQGEVSLELHVDGKGAVSAVKVVESSGFADLDSAAVRAARSARFTPAMSGGERVASTARLKLAFRLRGRE